MEFARFQVENIELGNRLRELEKLDRTTSEKMGDLDSDNRNCQTPQSHSESPEGGTDGHDTSLPCPQQFSKRVPIGKHLMRPAPQGLPAVLLVSEV